MIRETDVENDEFAMECDGEKDDQVVLKVSKYDFEFTFRILGNFGNRRLER